VSAPVRVEVGVRRGGLVGLVVALFLLPAAVVRANGAFPDSLQLLLPADHPEQIALATNFGLIISDDGGETWTWTCEQPQTLLGGLYAVGPAPRDRFFSVSPQTGLAYSDDASCSWQTSGGTLSTALASDVFPDPTDANHVLAVGITTVGTTKTFCLFESKDGGTTFGDAIYTAPDGAVITGVESAAADPSTIYLAFYTISADGQSLQPHLARSRDGGASWVTLDLGPLLGPTNLRIVAVAPDDPMTILLRVIDLASESVAISHDGGVTFSKVITIDNGMLSAFARLPDGTLLFGAVTATNGVGFRSTDGGLSFQDWPGVPHLSALAVRDGQLYAAARNYLDGWAVGVSADGGGSFTHLTRYDQVTGTRACAQQVCETSCGSLINSGTFPETACYSGVAATVDAGEPADGGAPPRDGGVRLPGSNTSGCSCAVPAGWRDGRAAAVALLVVAMALAAARRRRP
jgi:MYXO-CTERM domain-containing protein